MTDGVNITAGSGTKILTDDTGTDGHAQVVKLGVSADGSATLIPADATNGIDVDVTRTVPPTPAVVVMQNAATALGNGTSLDVQGYGAALLSVTGTFTAGLTFEASIDDTNWQQIWAPYSSDGTFGFISGFSNSAKDVIIPCAGYKSLRARISSYTDGSVTVKGAACMASPVHTTFIGGGIATVTGTVNATAAGNVGHDGSDSGNPIKLGGYASATAPSDVSADGDRVNGWFLRNGAQAVAIQGGGSLASVSNSSLQVTGGVAHDGVDAGNPIKIGARAIAHGTNPTAVAAADRTDLLANRAGVQFVIGGHPNVVSYAMSITTAVSNTVIGPTIASGSKFVVTGITVILDNASTVFPSVVIGFGTASTPAIATTPGTAKIVFAHPSCPAGGGGSRGDGSGIIGIGADDEELRVTTVGNAGGNGIYIVVTGYTIES